MEDDGHFGTRLSLFLGLLIPTVIIIEYYSIPIFLLKIYMAAGISFVISGLFYDLLKDLGLEFLDGITIIGFGGISALNLLVLILKAILGL